LKFAKENGRGLEVLSQYFPGGTEKNHENFEKISSLCVEAGERYHSYKGVKLLLYEGI